MTQEKKMQDDTVLKEAINAAATIAALYEHLDRIEKLGGATSISGVAACSTMLESLKKNKPRIEKLILAPLREAIAARQVES